MPFDASSNTVPSLNGKCLLCFARHEQFDEQVAEFKATQDSIRDMVSLVSVMSSHGEGNTKTTLASRVIAQMKRLTKLSPMSSDQVKRALMDCSQVIQSLGSAQFEASFSLVDQVRLALFMRQHLIEALEVKKAEKDGSQG